jgi:hypothetical protein
MSEGARWRAPSTTAATCSHSCRGHVNPLWSINVHAWPWLGVGYCPSNGLHCPAWLVWTVMTWQLSLVATTWPSSCKTSFTLCCLVDSLLPMPCPCCMDDVRTMEAHASWLGHIFIRGGLRSTLGQALSVLLVWEHLPRGEPGPKLWSGPDLPSELGTWHAHGISLGGASTKSERGFLAEPDVSPQSGPG